MISLALLGASCGQEIPVKEKDSSDLEVPQFFTLEEMVEFYGCEEVLALPTCLIESDLAKSVGFERNDYEGFVMSSLKGSPKLVSGLITAEEAFESVMTTELWQEQAKNKEQSENKDLFKVYTSREAKKVDSEWPWGVLSASELALLDEKITWEVLLVCPNDICYPELVVEKYVGISDTVFYVDAVSGEVLLRNRIDSQRGDAIEFISRFVDVKESL